MVLKSWFLKRFFPTPTWLHSLRFIMSHFQLLEAQGAPFPNLLRQVQLGDIQFLNLFCHFLHHQTWRPSGRQFRSYMGQVLGIQVFQNFTSLTQRLLTKKIPTQEGTQSKISPCSLEKMGNQSQSMWLDSQCSVETWSIMGTLLALSSRCSLIH